MKRRAFLTGLTAALAAPAIVKAENLMKIAVLRETFLLGPNRAIIMPSPTHELIPWGTSDEWMLGRIVPLTASIPTRLIVSNRAIDQLKRLLLDGKPLTSIAHPLSP